MKEHNASAKESPSASRDSSSCGAAEIANAEGNRLYREGNVEAAADAYTTALRESAMPHLRECRLLDTRENNALALLRSKYFANRSVPVQGCWCKSARRARPTGGWQILRLCLKIEPLLECVVDIGIAFEKRP